MLLRFWSPLFSHRKNKIIQSFRHGWYLLIPGNYNAVRTLNFGLLIILLLIAALLEHLVFNIFYFLNK